MTEKAGASPGKRSAFAPLSQPLFRNMWLASLLSNLGLFILGVGAAWGMTEMTGSATQVALVQTASMLPVALFSLLSGAIADMFDRRKVAIAALLVSIAGALSLTGLAHFGKITPTGLLAFCFVVGSGTALLWPAWGASVTEQVSPEMLSSAVALNGVSFNVARSFGPAIGGAVVAAVGGVGAFAVCALAYLPLLAVLLRWRRHVEPARLPPEGLGRAVISGLRYVRNAPTIRVAILRTMAAGFAGGSVAALLPLIARDLLRSDAAMFGLLLGAFGLGSVAGALGLGRVRAALSAEATIRASAAVMAVATFAIAESRVAWLTALVLFAFGVAWTGAMMSFNVTVQTASPRWVAARALAAFQAAVSAGVALGGWVWGSIASAHGVGASLLVSSAVLLASILLGLRLRLPTVEASMSTPSAALADPDVQLDITPRSGPIVIEIEYRVDPAQARPFYALMQHVQLSRQRNGAYGWSIARDMSALDLWTERYHCPTWHDYLRQRNRATQMERELHERALAFHLGPEPVRIRRMLERPAGSVRWQETTPDPGRRSDAPATHTGP